MSMKKIIRKIFEWPKLIESASYKLSLTKFHFIYMSFQLYFTHIGVKEMMMTIIKLLKMANSKRKESLIIIYLISIVIKNGMNILGVSLPEKM